ncbi:MAG: GTP cyclohydrolase II RibA [Hyphomicrobiales bacterium]|nr:GTP cyclohydrolase II RibA [Hyphomicrobiales bacterium]
MIEDIVSSAPFGPAAHIAVERGLAEFRSGRPVIVDSPAASMAALPIDGLSDVGLSGFRALCAPVRTHVVITERRARALGLAASGPVGLGVGDSGDAAALFSLIAEADARPPFDPVDPGVNAAAAIELAKLAQHLPALLAAEVHANAPNVCALMRVDAEAVLRFRSATAASLALVAEADVPLSGGIATRFVVFRDAIGGSSTAVIVGAPDTSRPVPLRVHSACLTGDVFGSRRCDCGDQLRLAIDRLDDEGGGIVLYLEQEGRGLGLANKMRAYKLQDDGLDTLDANTALGFDDDERDYGVAVRMLQILGCTRVKLMTNNPAKLDWLVRAGIDVCGRIPLHGPVNADNRRYLTAKAMRAGHKLGHLLTALSDTSPTAPVSSGPAE